MSTTVKDANVEDFLDRVKELDERRKIEDEIRRKKLREEVALKKKKFVVSNSDSPESSSSALGGITESPEIQLAHPVARIVPKDSTPVKNTPKNTSISSYTPIASSNSPSLYKYQNTADVDKTIERLIGRHPRGTIPARPASRRIPTPPMSPEITTDSSSSGDEEAPPALPARRDETPPKLPRRRESPLPTKKPEVPANRSSKWSTSSQSSSSNSGLYIPRPSAIAVMSATAAAKAPQLMRASVDSTLGERSPNLAETARLLTSTGNTRTPSPRKHQEENDSNSVESLSRDTTNISSPKRSSWLDSVLSHSSTTKQSIASTESKIKLKPLVPNKPNSLIINSEKAKENAENNASLIKSLTKPELSRPDFKKVASSAADKHEENSAVLARSSLNSTSREQVAQTRMHSGTPPPDVISKLSALKPLLPARKVSYHEPEALQNLNKLKPAVPVRKTSIHEPEALQSLNKLKKAAPLPKEAPDEPEALKKAGKLKPAVPSKKPELEAPEALQKISSLKRTEGSPMRASPVRKNFEQDNIDLLRNSMTGLKRKERPMIITPPPSAESSFAPTLPKRSQTDTGSPVRLPFTDPKAEFPTIIKPRTFDSASLSSAKESEKLSHVTKTRAKGPKRRLPKGITAQEPEAAKIQDFKVREKKKPPAIKSSSRTVSNKLEQRVFSNSELFI